MKRKLKQLQNDEDTTDNESPAPTRSSDDPLPKKVKWLNKQRVLVFASRGISHRDRHLMEDIRTLMPHSKPESKMERKDNLFVINEICEMKNCNKCIFFEGRLQRDLYMWAANVPNGPSAKFLVENVHTMAELKLTGNCLKGSRPLLSFDENFSKSPHYSVLKELFVQIFSTPHYHPKSQPFIDKVMTFSVLDNRIWFRNYQILSEDGALAEIGPRFVLNPIKIFDGSFGGEALWENPHYVSPALYRRQIKKAAATKYDNRLEKRVNYETTRPKESYNLNPVDDIFSGDPLKKADEIETENIDYRKIIQGDNNDLVQPKKLKKKKMKKQKEGIINRVQAQNKKHLDSGKQPKNSNLKKKFKKQKWKKFQGSKSKSNIKIKSVNSKSEKSPGT